MVMAVWLPHLNNFDKRRTSVLLFKEWVMADAVATTIAVISHVKLME